MRQETATCSESTSLRIEEGSRERMEWKGMGKREGDGTSEHSLRAGFGKVNLAPVETKMKRKMRYEAATM